MELLQLKYFRHAAKTENFSHTAQYFMVPTSGVSAAIKKLEAEIGVKLFDRTANRVRLNEYGKILLQAVDKSEELFNKARVDILDLSQTPFGELKLLILTNRQKVTEVISEFRVKYPKTAFHINHQGVQDVANLGEYDIIVTDRNISTDSFNKSFWFREEILLATHKNSQLSEKNTVSAGDLKNEKFICMPQGSSLRHCTDNYFEQKRLSPDIVIECDDPQYIRNYLKMGLGVTFFPSISWKNHVSNDIRLLRIDDGLYRDSYIYTNKSRSNIVHLFSQMLKTSGPL